MTSQNKNGVDSRGILRGTLYRVVSVEMAFSYDNVYILQQGGKVRYLQDKCAQFCVHIET